MQKKYLCDSHTHSSCSFDAENTVDELCQAAVKKGLYALTVTDHCEANFYDGSRHSEFGDFSVLIPQSVEQIHTAQKKYNGRLKLLCGIELGEPMQNLSASLRILELADFDFVLASVHNIQGEKDFYWLSYSADMVDGLLNRYFGELLQTAKWNRFDSLAHLTYPLRYIVGRGGLAVDLSRYQDKIDLILRVLAVNGKALEVNSSGLRQEIGQTMPDKQVIRRFKELGGKYVTVGSDAHKCEDLAKGISNTYGILKECGFDYYTVYEKRKPLLLPL